MRQLWDTIRWVWLAIRGGENHQLAARIGAAFEQVNHRICSRQCAGWGFRCTRHADHQGPHVALDSKAIVCCVDGPTGHHCGLRVEPAIAFAMNSAVEDHLEFQLASITAEPDE